MDQAEKESLIAQLWADFEVLCAGKGFKPTASINFKDEVMNELNANPAQKSLLQATCSIYFTPKITFNDIEAPKTEEVVVPEVVEAQPE